jgi:hypothetical protein
MIVVNLNDTYLFPRWHIFEDENGKTVKNFNFDSKKQKIKK